VSGDPSALVVGAFQVRGSDAASALTTVATTATRMSTAINRRDCGIDAVAARVSQTLPLIAVCLLVHVRDSAPAFHAPADFRKSQHWLGRSTATPGKRGARPWRGALKTW
jgi:hypothetical protein